MWPPPGMTSARAQEGEETRQSHRMRWYVHIVLWPCWQAREVKESLLRNAAIFETLNDAQIEALGTIVVRTTYKPADEIIVQGERGQHLYLLEDGECMATVRIGDDPAQVREECGAGPCGARRV